ncbi:MAG: segregation/condensation protein A [Phycisphaerales bacterium]|nr:segregation/condensation protein A [Phycisphaerales bacterium]
MSTEYRVRLESFEGPMDLLLHLIRRAEVDIHDIPIARIAEQYVAHLAGIERIDIELAGEFLLLAATLTEIKSRVLAAPEARAGAEGAAETPDPRAELVRQLLEYKRTRDVAEALDRRRREWELRAPVSAGRAARGTPAEQPTETDLDDLTIQDLVEAFARIAESVNFAALGSHEVLDDSTPLELHAEDLLDCLRRAPGPLTLRSVLEGRARKEMLGLFLAMLELVRQRRLRVRQSGESILIEARPEEPDLAEADSETANAGVES